MIPGPAAGEEPRRDRIRRIARPGTARIPPGWRARADPAEAGYLEDVGRLGDDPAPGAAPPSRARRNRGGGSSSQRRDARPPGNSARR